MFIEHITTFFETFLGEGSLPEWVYIAFGFVILMCLLLSFIKLLFPKLSKYAEWMIIAISLGYILYQLFPLWGVGASASESSEVLKCFSTLF